MPIPTRTGLLALAAILAAPHVARADGPADNVPATVRRIPKPGITLSPEIRNELNQGLTELKAKIDAIPDRVRTREKALLPDVLVLEKAVHDALTHDEFFEPGEVNKARDLLKLAVVRAEALARGEPDWPKQTGLVVRGFVSKIDGSVQPYGLVVPPSYTPQTAGRYRLDVWFHGRGETLSELNFLDQRRKAVGEFAPPDTIVLHPYGRYCNAFKIAGEVDVLEAIDAVKAQYRVDDDRVAVRGFSMGGAACWQFAVHYADRWFAANPGAGFAETPRFLKVFQRETLKPSWFEQKLWRMYDCDLWAENLAQCPTVAYSGELDNQKQAADLMAEAMDKVGLDLVHVIGPQTRHAYHPEAKREVERRLAGLAREGRTPFPAEVRFTTYTLKYNRMAWVTVDALDRHWERSHVHGRVTPEGSVRLDTENVTRLTLDFPPGFAPFPATRPVSIALDGSKLEGPRPRSDRSWSVSLEKGSGGWSLAKADGGGLRKRHDLQGPIDDAFMDSFVFVRPTGKSRNAKFQAWVDQEMPRAVEHWRRQFRGEARVKDDTAVTDEDAAHSNLVLWGDADSNAWVKKVAGRLPIAWDAQAIRVGDRTFGSDSHALIAVYPNPQSPTRYVVLNSGFTYREYDYLNNARQVPKLPDWAVIDLNTPPDSRSPGRVVAADFFGERWELRPRTDETGLRY